MCDACRDIDSGRFVDYVELDAASNRGVDEISQLLDQAVYKPVMGRFKVYMIDEVHMLSNTAFNAMLKTLEEPPDYLKFVLATTDPQKVPPTVLSRCLQFNLRPMAPQTVQEHLVSVMQAESLSAEVGALRLLARAAKGSMRDALSLTDQAIAFGGGALTEAGVRLMLGAVDRSHAVRLLEALSQNDGAGLVQVADQLRDLGLSASGTLEEMADLLQQMAVEQAVPGALDQTDPDAPAVIRLASAFAADEVQLAYSMCLHGRAELGLAPDEYSGLVMVLLRLLAFRPGGTGTQPLANSQRVESNSAVPRAPAQTRAAPAPMSAALLASRPATVSRPVVAAAAPLQAATTVVAKRGPAPTTAASDEPPSWVDEPAPWEEDGSSGLAEPRARVTAPVPHAAAPGPANTAGPAHGLVTTPEGDRWTEVVRAMVAASTIQALVRELAMQAQCVGIDDKSQPAVWRLRVERESLRSATHVDKLQLALGQLLLCPVRIEVEAGVAQDNPAQRAQAEKDLRQQEAEALVHNDPVVREMMSQFKSARIVPGSIRPLA